MGSSGSSNYRQPNIPSPPANMISPQGQTANKPPFYPSFLPGGGVVATPESVAAAGAMGPPQPSTPAQPPAGGGGGGFGYAQMLDMLGGMGMFTGGGQQDPRFKPGLGPGGFNMPNIPPPPQGANGVAPGDLAAYQRLQGQQQARRDELAKAMQNRSKVGTKEWRQAREMR